MGNASYWIEHLKLQPHPEGGWFAETYRATEAFETQRGQRNACTAIYFLLKAGEVSKFHVLDQSGHRTLDLGPNHQDGQSFQAMVPQGTWFAAELLTDGGFALVGCTVSPGFDFSDFEMAKSETLLDGWSNQETLIERLS